jgi:hypothetical protein
MTDKRQALIVHTGKDLENRLFFAARNLAIEAMLLRLENGLVRQGFNAKCVWAESSFRAPVLELRLVTPSKDEDQDDYAQCTAWLSRDRIASPSHLSHCFYALERFDKYQGEGRESKKLLAFRDAVSALHESGQLAAEIAKVNYPFEYEPLSSF